MKFKNILAYCGIVNPILIPSDSAVT
jgi:hypothetical protein